MSRVKNMLVLLAGGYSTRLDGVAKHAFMTPEGHYLFEHLILNTNPDSLTVICNKANREWWFAWFQQRGKMYRIPINILVEPHNKPNEAYGPVRYLTSNIPATFSRFAENVVVAPIDGYFSDYKFASKLMEKNEAIVVAKYPKEYMRNMGVVRLNLRGKMVNFIEKPSLPEGSWVFTGIFKLSMDSLVLAGMQNSKNVGDCIKTLFSKGHYFDVVKHGGVYWDVGIPPIANDLINKGLIKQ